MSPAGARKSSMMNLIRELKDFLVFFLRTAEKEKKIVFYAEDASYYIYLEGLVERLTTVEDVKISYITSDISDPILYAQKKNVQSF